MTFLSPIPAIIAAAICVPVLVTFFLLKLRRRPVRVGSTMLWDQAVRDLQANVPFRWLRPSWLLLLALLILALLLLALARPAIDAGASRADQILLIIDRSASMSATDAGEGRTRLSEAKRRAGEFVGSLRRSGFAGTVSVIASASEARSVISATRDLRAVERAIEAIEASDQVGDLAAALALGETQVTAARAGGEGNEGNTSTAIAVVYSDGGGEAGSRLAIAGATARFERITPVGTLNNAGITAISAARDFEDPAIVRCFVRVQSTHRGAGLAVSLTRDGELIGRQAVSFGAGGEDAGDGAAGGGGARAAAVVERALTFEFVDTEGGLLVASIGRADALASDDAAGLYLPAPVRPAIVVVRDGAGDDAARLILDTVLRELRPRSLEFLTRPASVSERERALFGGADLVVLDAAVPGGMAAIDAPIIALGVAPSQIAPEADGAEIEAIGATDVVRWDREHPIMRGMTMDAVVVSRGIALPDGDDFVPLAMGRQGPLISLWRRGAGDALLVGFDLYYSNWIDAGLAIFLANAVEYLTSASSPETVFVRTGELVRLAPAEGAASVALVDDAGGVVLEREVGEASGPVALGVVERVGVYETRGARIPALAVNLLSPNESAIASREDLRIGGEVLAGSGEGDDAPMEIWHWLVIAAGVLLMVEWVVYALRMRV